MQTESLFDVIGDIHGHADALHQLLERLGYSKSNGAYQHPERKALFLGDFIDRGPAQMEVLSIVRDMMEAGQAESVMGNHELNAIGWFHEGDDGQPLRPRSQKNRVQHQAFLDQVGEDSQQHQSWIDWFMTLPIWIEKPHLQLVHACWCETSMSQIMPLLTPQLQLQPEYLHGFFQKNTAAYRSIETLLKGVEVDLPAGYSFQDKDGTHRRTTRIQWWKGGRESHETTLDRVVMMPEKFASQLPKTPVGDSLEAYGSIRKPTFIGHYWLDGEPSPLTDWLACLDYSIAKAGHLVAYRFSGEMCLNRSGFVAHQ